MSAAELIEDLESSTCYPHGVTSVRLVQTHLSVVCITDQLVYKLKKAVALPFVDFSTLASRQQACRDEVRLNRRLCPDVYLGVVGLRRIDGQLCISALDDLRQDDLDAAVVMRRLPQQEMLDERLAQGTVDVDALRELARVIAAFHRSADRSDEITALGHPDRLAGFARDNFAALRDDGGSDLLRATEAASERAFAAALPTLRRRAERGYVVDGHGDLHARNICMTAPPTIYDCIEFEPAFRCGDVATEVAFLAMDLRYRGAAALARAFVDAYVQHSGDDELPGLLPVLCSYRAMVRAKVAALTARESEIPEGERDHAHASAKDHVSLAAVHLLDAQGNTWLVVCGPPASGKSRLARAMARRGGWTHLATDEVRKQLAGVRPDQPAKAEHYSAAFSQRTYDELLRRAAQQTTGNATVVLLDGNFATRRRRDELRNAARAAGATMRLLCVDVDVETAVQRAAARVFETGNVSDADAAVTRTLHGRFEHPTPDEPDVHVLDGATPTRELEDAALTIALDAGLAP